MANPGTQSNDDALCQEAMSAGFTEITLIDGRTTAVYVDIDVQTGETLKIYTSIEDGLVLTDDDGEEYVFELVPTQNSLFGSVHPDDFEKFYELAPKNGLMGVGEIQEDLKEYSPDFYSKDFWSNPIVSACCVEMELNQDG